MKRCAAITKSGERCKRIAIDGYEYCYAHRPDLANERSRNASKAGKAGGRGRPAPLEETNQAKRYVRGLVTQLLDGTVRRDVAATCFMGLNTFARYLELERKIRETNELEERIAALEYRYDIHNANRSSSWSR